LHFNDDWSITLEKPKRESEIVAIFSLQNIYKDVKPIRLTLAIAAIGLLNLAAHAQNFITNGLVAYYPFNGNPNDASGNGNNGIVNGATLTPDRFGNANSAYSFNGINNNISFASLPLTQVDDWTMTAWLQPASLNQAGIAVSMGYDPGPSAPGGNGYSFGILGQDAYPLYETLGNQLFGAFGYVEGFYGGFTFTSTNQWYQVVMMRSAGVTTFYVGGVATPTGTTSTPLTPTAFTIGSENGLRYFNGAIDDVRIYNRALSSNEVAQLYAFENTFSIGPASFILSSSPVVGNGPHWVVAADVNGDGYVDLICANYYSDTLSVLTNDGHGGFVLASSPMVGNNPQVVTAADVNGDGFLDLICADYGDNTLTVLTNDGHGTFMLASSPGVGINPFSVTAADVNGDGKVDLISANLGDSTLTVLTNDGYGGFVLACSPFVGSYPESVAAADVNGDGRVELICSIFNDNALVILTNNGASIFGSNTALNVGNGPVQVIAADVNHDGNVDLICGNYLDNTLTVLTNDGSGNFGSNATYSVGSNPFSFTTADVNGDGKVDLISVNSGDNTLTVLTNDGYGSFALAASPGVGNVPQSVVAADVNGDGKVDLISANFGATTLTVLTNAPFSPPLPPHTATATAEWAGKFVVGVDIIDGGAGYTNIPSVRFIGGGGNGAQASVVVSNGVVVAIDITNPGSGYTNTPVVVIDPPFISNPVLGIASISILNFSNLLVGTNYQLQQFQSTTWINQSASFKATNGFYTTMVSGVASSDSYRLAQIPVPVQATAFAQVVNGFVVNVLLNNPGSGYVIVPNVAIIANVGSNATAVASISNGRVTNIAVTSAGIHYFSPVTVQIDPPPVTVLSPAVTSGVVINSSSLAPYDNYQILFRSDFGNSWGNLSGGLFSPTATTNSQYVFLTNGIGFFRLQYMP
jgi:hypothetical protein